MDCRLPILDYRFVRPGRRSGFSFTEVLFAVMVMGIGFIMVAAMFPVTIRNQQSTQEETIAAAVARAALSYLQENDIIRQIANDQQSSERRKSWDEGQVLSVAERKPDGRIRHDDAPVWDALAGNMILPDNPRVAWVPLFRKADPQSGLAQVFIFVVQNRNRPQYQTWIPDPANPTDPTKALGSDLYRTRRAGEDAYASIEPKPVYVTTYWGRDVEGDPDAPDRIKFEDPKDRPYGTGTAAIPDYAAWKDRANKDVNGVHVEGAYVVIAEPDNRVSERHMIGRIYQLGARVDTTQAPDSAVFAKDDIVYKLIPGNDMIVTDVPLKKDSSSPSKAGAKAYIIGRGLRDPTKSWHELDNPFEGPAQDVAIYMSYIKLQE